MSDTRRYLNCTKAWTSSQCGDESTLDHIGKRRRNPGVEEERTVEEWKSGNGGLSPKWRIDIIQGDNKHGAHRSTHKRAEKTGRKGKEH